MTDAQTLSVSELERETVRHEVVVIDVFEDGEEVKVAVVDVDAVYLDVILGRADTDLSALKLIIPLERVDRDRSELREAANDTLPDADGDFDLIAVQQEVAVDDVIEDSFEVTEVVIDGEEEYAGVTQGRDDAVLNALSLFVVLELTERDLSELREATEEMLTVTAGDRDAM